MPNQPLFTSPAMPEYWSSAFDVVPFPIYVVDMATLELINVNRTMRKRTGDTEGKKCYEAIYRKDKPCAFCAIPGMQDGDMGRTIIFEHFNEADDRWYQLQETRIAWFDGRPAKYSIAVDVTQLKGAQNALAEAHADLAIKNRELERLTITDSLTGIGNRRHLTAVLEHEVASARRSGLPLSLLLIDVDRFKLVNDTFGHQAGDAVLAKVAKAIVRNVRGTDTAGRWGGEEFIVVCPGTTETAGAAVAEKLRLAIAAQTHSDVGAVSCSIGVAELQAGESAATMLGRADAALYCAKTEGRNRTAMAGPSLSPL
jgi:diguanylate cyclase (GGDEF)-like protein